MKLSFNDDIESEECNEAAAKKAVAERTSTAIAVPGECDDLVGEISGDDLILPRINLTQKVGDLGDEFGPGVLVFQKEQVLWKEEDDPINVVILHAQKRYQENTEFGSDEMGQVVDTLDEVKTLGGRIDWCEGEDGRREPPPWGPRLDLVCAVEAPEGAETSLFPFEYEDRAFAPAVWTLSKSAFTNAGRGIVTARKTFLRDGYRTGKWQVTAAKKQGPKGVYFVPAFRASGKTDEAFQEFLAGMYHA